MASNLYQDVFPLVCTSSIKQTLKIPKSISCPSIYGTEALATVQLFGWCLWGRGGRQEVAVSCLPTRDVHPPAAGGGLGAPPRVWLG